MDRLTPLTTPAVVVLRLGGPEVLQVQAWEIAGPAPDEVRVRVEAAGISFADLLVMQGCTRGGASHRSFRAGTLWERSNRPTLTTWKVDGSHRERSRLQFVAAPSSRHDPSLGPL